VDSVEGLIPGSELAIQAACYHITDVGSLRPGTKAKDAYEVLSTIIQPSRSSSASAEGDVSMGNTTATAAATPSAAEATAAAAASSISTQSSIPQVEPPSSSSGLGPTDVARMMMQRAIAAAQAAAAKGERCSGCVVALDNQVICEVGSGVQALKGDATATAPILAVRALMGSGDSKMHAPVHAAQAPLVPEADRSRCVVYCSEEPCAMGVGAFYWAGVGSIVFAASSAQVKALERKHGAAGRGGGVQGSGSSSTASAMDSEATGQTSIPSCSDLLTHAARPIPVQGGFLATAALSAMQQAFTSNNGEKLVTGRKRAAEDAADASKESTTTTTVRVKPATATEEACTVIESGGWTVTTHELPAPMRIEAFVTVHC
jgi:tRNA(Arg) A34 adenosine deaminase TadA